MLSKNQFKLITSLQQKKYRKQYQLFIAEGIKVVNELLSSNYKLETLFCVNDCYELFKEFNPQIISNKELLKISNLSTPNKVLGIFKIPKTVKIKEKGLILVLDSVNDPGNLGTIIRLSDWFGVSHIVCSMNTVDCYNSKVVQATMGSLTRVPISYVNIEEFLNKIELPIYGAIMNGENIYSKKLVPEAVLVMGNESNGVSKKIMPFLTTKITIPKFNKNTTIESLNVATATAILLNEFRRV